MRNGLLIACCALALSVVVVVPSVSEAQVKKTGSKYQLRMKWTKGQKFGYDLEMTQVGAGSKPMKMGIDYNVKSVKGTTGNVDVTVNGMGSSPQTEQVSIDERGRMTGSNSAAGFSNILEYPQEAVAVGGSWKTKASLPGMAGGTMTGTATNTLKGFRTISGKEYAHVFTELNTTGGGVSGKGKTDTLIAMSDGQLLRSTMSLKMSITTKDSSGKPSSQSIDMSIKMTRK